MQNSKNQQEYESFNSGTYLTEYYQEIGPENDFLLEMFAKAATEIPVSASRHLELGGGPTIYQLISIASRVESILFTDYSRNNLDEVEKWVAQDPQGFDWGAYFNRALELETGAMDEEAAKAREAELRAKIQEVKALDLFDADSLSAYKGSYSVVSAVFCTDAITHSVEEWSSLISRIANVLDVGNYFILVGVLGSHNWTMGNESFKATSLTRDQVEEKIESLDMDMVIFETKPAENAAHGYDSVFFVLAKKR